MCIHIRRAVARRTVTAGAVVTNASGVCIVNVEQLRLTLSIRVSWPAGGGAIDLLFSVLVNSAGNGTVSTTAVSGLDISTVTYYDRCGKYLSEMR